MTVTSVPQNFLSHFAFLFSTMSRRGGGGRRPDSRRDQPTQAPAPSFQRGGGGASGPRGRGRRGQPGGGTGRGLPSGSGAAPSSSHAASTSTAPAPSSPSVSASASSSSPVSTLAEETEQKMTLAAPAAATLPPSSSQAVRFPVRPGFGTVGRKCVVRANHFMVQLSERDIHHYDVSLLLILIFVIFENVLTVFVFYFSFFSSILILFKIHHW